MAAKHSILKWSISQLQKHIRFESGNTVNVIFTDHALKRMKERKITNSMALETLRKGKINQQPEIDFEDLKCRMEYHVAGVEIKLIVALSDDNPKLVLVTAI